MELETGGIEKKGGSIFPILVVVSLLVAGGVYFFVERLHRPTPPVPYIPGDSGPSKQI